MRVTSVLLICMFLFSCMIKTTRAQVIDTFWVAGDVNKFYPVTFADGARGYNIATQLELGRSSVHQDSTYRGSLIARFAFHTYNWGHGSNFIDADIREFNTTGQPNRFIAGWTDASGANSTSRIIIWLRGKTTYFYRSNYPVTPTIYDGVANPLPFQQTNGPAHTYKTAIESYVNVYGMSYGNTAYFTGAGNNHFAGNVGIGTTDTKGYKLAVNGEAIFTRVKVKPFSGWPDYVFSKDYELPSLQEVEKYIEDNNHLPGIPSAVEVGKEGLDLGEMNKRLLQKVEELTLYIIEQQKTIDRMQAKDAVIESRLLLLEKK